MTWDESERCRGCGGKLVSWVPPPEEGLAEARAICTRCDMRQPWPGKR